MVQYCSVVPSVGRMEGYVCYYCRMGRVVFGRVYIYKEGNF